MFEKKRLIQYIVRIDKNDDDKWIDFLTYNDKESALKTAKILAQNGDRVKVVRRG